MPADSTAQDGLDPATRAFYRHALERLRESQVPFLVGGGYALERYTGFTRDIKDLDIFVCPEDCQRVLAVLAAAGYRTELAFSHWLGKVFCGEDLIDVIFNASNGNARVDPTWFAHAVPGEWLDIPVQFCPVEEMIWQKAFIMERERYDGADVAHLLRTQGDRLDWRRLLDRFGPHWPVLFSHLVLFRFIYPTEQTLIPDWVMTALLSRSQSEVGSPPPTNRVCRGTLLSLLQYLGDLERWGYQDARIRPSGGMTEEETARWTAAFVEDGLHE